MSSSLLGSIVRGTVPLMVLVFTAGCTTHNLPTPSSIARDEAYLRTSFDSDTRTEIALRSANGKNVYRVGFFLNRSPATYPVRLRAGENILEVRIKCGLRIDRWGLLEEWRVNLKAGANI